MIPSPLPETILSSVTIATLKDGKKKRIAYWRPLRSVTKSSRTNGAKSVPTTLTISRSLFVHLNSTEVPTAKIKALKILPLREAKREIRQWSRYADSGVLSVRESWTSRSLRKALYASERLYDAHCLYERVPSDSRWLGSCSSCFRRFFCERLRGLTTRSPE